MILVLASVANRGRPFGRDWQSHVGLIVGVHAINGRMSTLDAWPARVKGIRRFGDTLGLSVALELVVTERIKLVQAKICCLVSQLE